MLSTPPKPGWQVEVENKIPEEASLIVVVSCFHESDDKAIVPQEALGVRNTLIKTLGESATTMDWLLPIKDCGADVPMLQAIEAVAIELLSCPDRLSVGSSLTLVKGKESFQNILNIVGECLIKNNAGGPLLLLTTSDLSRNQQGIILGRKRI